MDNFIDELFLRQREHIVPSGKLGKITKDKLLSIMERTYIPFTSSNIYQDCWLWNGTTIDNAKGHCHGVVWFEKNYVLIHRLLYHNFIENVPPYTNKQNALQVNHKCSHQNNGRCINPWHCYLGTSKMNMRDALREGTKYRMPKGQENHNATLSDDIVLEIKQLKGKTSLTQREIAAKYNVSQSQISRWWNGITRK
jgi:predicted XRE-type DNA-binding protein